MAEWDDIESYRVPNESRQDAIEAANEDYRRKLMLFQIAACGVKARNKKLAESERLNL